MIYSEVFHSIQGEGKFVGMPSVFFRTSFCNLRCIWCDTPYTSWEPEKKEISVDDAVNVITDYGCKHVVITGGEPCAQGTDLLKLCDKLADRDHYITIETNATIFISPNAHLISMSPKLRNSNPDSEHRLFENHDKSRIQPDVIRNFLNNYHCQVKFVVDDQDDIAEIKQLQDEIPIPKEDILLMAQGMTESELWQIEDWLVEMCKNDGYRFSPRAHINIWGDRRGV